MTKTRSDRQSIFARRREETSPLRRHALAGERQLDSPGASDVGVAFDRSAGPHGAANMASERDQRIATHG